MTDIRAMWCIIGLMIMAGAILIWNWGKLLLPEESTLAKLLWQFIEL